MKTTTKNLLLGLAGSAILISAVALTATPNKFMTRDFDRPGANQRINAKIHRNVDTDWKNFAECYNINQNDITNLLDKGYRPRDIRNGAFLSMASGKGLDEVMNLKTPDNTWQDVEKSLNITFDQIKTTRNNLVSTRLTSVLSIDKATIDSLLANGYHPRDISMASILATKTNKPINEILNMKVINNSWLDISQQLGVDKATFDTILTDHRTKAAQINGFDNGPHNGFGYGMMDDDDIGYGMMNGPHRSLGKGNNNPPRNPEDCLRNN